MGKTRIFVQNYLARIPSIFMKTIVLFASGSGSNVENIFNYFRSDPGVRIGAVLTNNNRAAVLDRCLRLEVPAYSFNKAAWQETGAIISLLNHLNTDLIVLAGFLWKVPAALIQAYPNRIVNIHPALLPKYGGKGMYGMKVHQAVHESGDPESGISVHYINEHYDEGDIILQVRTAIHPEDSPETIADKIHRLEYRHYPEVIAQLLRKL